MISENHFRYQMNRLAETFGANHYKSERVRMIWQAIKDLSDHWLEKTVDSFIGYQRHAPLLEEFSGEISKERERQGGAKVIPISWGTKKYKCDHCMDNGVYLCKSRINPGFWAFRCNCEKGESDSRTAIPQFKSAHLEEFYYYEVAR